MIQLWFRVGYVKLWFSYGSGLFQIWSTLAQLCFSLGWLDVLWFSPGSAWFSKMVVAWVFLVQFSCVSMGQRWFSCVSALVQLWLSLVGTSGVELVRVRLRVGSDWAVLWCAVMCVWPQLVWFSVGSAWVQVCVAT